MDGAHGEKSEKRGQAHTSGDIWSCGPASSRDFDVSPYFGVIKPTIKQGFDYRLLGWAEQTVDEPAADR
jgi:hypothetical protein